MGRAIPTAADYKAEFEAFMALNSRVTTLPPAAQSATKVTLGAGRLWFVNTFGVPVSVTVTGCVFKPVPKGQP